MNTAKNTKAVSDEVVRTAYESRKLVYQELCNSYRAIDTFRTALLGLLPLASGAGIVLLYNQGKAVEPEALAFLPALGMFGVLVVLGLFMFEIYGIRKCHALILAGTRLEDDLGVVGQFKSRPRDVLGVINEPFATSIIYPAVLAAWAFVGLFTIHIALAVLIALLFFGIGFGGTWKYNIWLKSQKGNGASLASHEGARQAEKADVGPGVSPTA